MLNLDTWKMKEGRNNEGDVCIFSQPGDFKRITCVIQTLLSW